MKAYRSRRISNGPELCSLLSGAWVGGEFDGEWIHGAAALSPFAVRLKLTLLSSCTLIQNKKFFRKKSPMIDENRMPRKLLFFLIGGWLLYNAVLISALQWVTQLSVFTRSLPPGPPSHLALHPAPLVTTEHWAELPVLWSRLPLALYFTHGSGYVSILISQSVPSSPSLPMSTQPFPMSVSLIEWFGH